MESNYEFNDKQNKVFRLLQLRMRFVGIIFIAVGILISLVLILSKIEYLNFNSKFTIIGTIFSVFLMVTGILFWRAANAFLKIIKTQGSDIEILMDAVKDLYFAFDIQMYMILVSIFFILMATVFLRNFNFF